jgi:Bacterial SH3 domain
MQLQVPEGNFLPQSYRTNMDAQREGKGREHMLRLLVATVCVFAAAGAAAEPVRVSSAALKAMLPGALLKFDTPLHTTIPVRFFENGLVSGKAGALSSMLGAARDRGRWWVEDDVLCMKWFRWFEAKKRCVVVRQEGDMLYWRGEDRSGTAQIAERAKKPELVAEVTKAAPKAAPKASPEAPQTAVKPSVAETDVSVAVAAPDTADTTADTTADAPPVVVASTPETPATPEAPAAIESPAIPDNDESAKPGRRLKFAAAAAAGSVPYKLFGSRDVAPAPPAAAPSIAPAPSAPAPGRTAKVAPAATQYQRAAAASQKAEAARRRAEAVRRLEKANAAARQVAANHAARVSSSTLIMPTSFRVARVDADDILNVRSGPSEFAEQVGAIPPQGRGVRIVGACQKSWCPIVHGRTKGWVNRYFLTAEEAASRAAR